MVDVTDLLALIAQFGAPGSADLDGDGVVDADDLLVLLGAWGPAEQRRTLRRFAAPPAQRGSGERPRLVYLILTYASSA
jgi:hypothetical protein